MRSIDHKDLFTFLLREHRLGRVRFRKRDMETTCPRCERERKFSVDVFSGRYACFTCDLSGNMYRTLAEERARWRPIRETLGGRSGALSAGTSGCPAPGGPRGTSSALWTLDGLPWVPTEEQPRLQPSPAQMKVAYHYCLGRGMTVGQIAKYRVAVVPYQPRVYFNYWDNQGQITFWMGRSTSPSVEPKTLEPGTDKPLFGTHVLGGDGGELAGRVVPLVEGVFDHFSTPGSLATMGSFLSGAQAADMAKLAPAWVPVLYDPDAHDKALKAASLLWAHGVPAAAIRWGDNTADPGSLGWARMSAIVEQLERMGPPGRCCAIDVRV